MSERFYILGLVLGMFDTNCYIAADAFSREAIVIDPADEPHSIIEAVRRDGLAVRGIVNTHGHADHIGANGALREEFGCPIMIHELDAPKLTDPEANLSVLMGGAGLVSPPADRLLKQGDEIKVGKLAFRVIHTPGHTMGGICLVEDGVLFSGDMLFAGGIGRMDFPDGSHEHMIHSIHTKLLTLPDDTAVYPGHGAKTTIGEERRENPWL